MKLPLDVRRGGAHLSFGLRQQVEVVHHPVQTPADPVGLVHLLGYSIDGHHQHVETGADDLPRQQRGQWFVEVGADEGGYFLLVGVGHKLVDPWIQERFAPAIKGQPNARVFDLVDDAGENIEAHHPFFPVNITQTSMAQGALELADIGGVYLPFVRRAPDSLADQAQL